MRIGLLSKLALRNLKRQLRRSFLTAAAMVIGLALLVFSRALAEGSHEDWIKSGSRMAAGHLTVQAPGFHETKKIEHHLDGAQTRAVLRILGDSILASVIESAVPRITTMGLASSPANAIPVLVLGVDPATEPDFSQLNQKLIEGRYLEPGDRLQAFVGKILAERLHLQLGSRFVLTGQDASGEMAGQLVRVAGIFRLGVPEADQGMVHIPLSTAQAWLGLGDGVTSYDILLKSTDSELLAREMLGELEESHDVLVLGWRETQPELNAAVKMDDFGSYIFHGILFGIITLAIVNTILMSVLQRIREFGVLRALGLQRSEAGMMVFIEGLMLTAVSGLVGMVLGIAFTWGFFRDGLDFSSFMGEGEFTMTGTIINPIIIPRLGSSEILLSLTAIVVIGVLSSIYPAYRATKIDVAESMKFET